jgi:hypothetical protein
MSQMMCYRLTLFRMAWKALRISISNDELPAPQLTLALPSMQIINENHPLIFVILSQAPEIIEEQTRLILQAGLAFLSLLSTESVSLNHVDPLTSESTCDTVQSGPSNSK